MDNFWQDKKIIAYIALAHHTRFIIPVMQTLERLGATVKYIVGQAERSQEVTAINMGLSYSHIFDYLTEDDNEDIRENYSLMRKTFQASLKKEFFMGILPVTVTDKTLLSTALEYTGFKNLFEKEKPDLCFALHEINRWGKLFAFWAKKNNVPFISLQEGLSYGLDFGLSGHAQYSSLNLVWGERIRKKLTSFEAPESKVLAVGNTHLSQEIARQKKERIRETQRKVYKLEKKFISLLILSARLAKPELFYPIFSAVSKDADQAIFVKFHPAGKKDQIDSWVSNIKEKYPHHSYFIHGEESTYDLISVSDVVILGQKSTTGLEALAFGKPIVKMDFAYEPKAPYSFVKQGVAAMMSAPELAEKLKGKIDFNTLIDPERIKKYLEWELSDTGHAIQRVCEVFRKSIQANRFQPEPFAKPIDSATRKWSIVLEVSDSPETLLAQIEALAVNSTGGGPYETFLVLPDRIAPATREILDSLEGDIKWIRPEKGTDTIVILNQALKKAAGETFIFIGRGLAPLEGWLTHLELGMTTHGKNFIYSARLTDRQGKIVHAGMVVDHNHTPVSAYEHLDIHFKPALKERPFQMADHFMAVSRDLFMALGGLTPEAGDFRYPDFCLKAQKAAGDDTCPVMYLPDLQLISLASPAPKQTQDHSIFFFNRWHGELWESAAGLLKEDAISVKDLEQQRLSSAMKILG